LCSFEILTNDEKPGKGKKKMKKQFSAKHYAKENTD
jgi:hypothetical protein